MLKRSLIFLFILPLYLYGFENSFKSITPEDGLTQGNIYCIYQDKLNYMWFGTFNGLNRFDGYDIKTYYTNSEDSLSLGYGHVKSICEDSKDRLWLGTFGGGLSIYYLKEDYFRNIKSVSYGSEELKLSNISGLIRGDNGLMYVLEQDLGLLVFNEKFQLKELHRLPSTLNDNAINTFYGLAKDSKGFLWVASGSNTLTRFDTKSGRHKTLEISDKANTIDDIIRAVYVDYENMVWIGTTSQGAYKYDPAKGKIVNFRKGPSDFDLSSNTIQGFMDDAKGNMYFATDGGGLNILDTRSGHIRKLRYDLTLPNSISTDAVYCVFLDKTETLWVGTYAGGVNYQGKYQNKFTTYKPNPTNKNSLSYKNVLSILEDTDRDIWIGTDGGGLNRFVPSTGKFEHFRANPDDSTWLQTDVIIHMMQDKDGDLFLGSYNGGLTVFNKNTRVFKQYLPEEGNPNSIAGLHPWYVFQDSYNEIWVGLLAVGINKFDKETQTFKRYYSDYSNPKALKSPNLKVIYEDRKRQVWIGTEGGGLHRYNRKGDNFIRFNAKSDVEGTLANDDVRALFEDSKGRFWVGTGGGLNLMERDSSYFYYIEGLPSNIINDILEDDAGNLWISTNAGLTKYNHDLKTFRNYNVSDGLQGNEFNYTAAIRASDGNFYFGGQNGFNQFKPEEIIDNPYKPNLVISDFLVANVPQVKVKVKTRRKSSSYTIPYLKEMKISHKQNVLEFGFSALDYTSSEKNKYRYKLEGFDENWTEVDANKRFASYTNLDGGTYTLRIVASNNDGLWNNEGVSLKIIVTPPVYQRWWFITLMIMLMGYVVYKYIKNKQQKIIKEKEQLEAKVRSALVEVEARKSELGKKDEELRKKVEDERVHNWNNEGLNRINQVISSNEENLRDLSKYYTLTLAEYLNVPQAALYLLNDNSEEDIFLEVVAAYAPDDNRLIGSRVEEQEGNIGTCFKTKEILKINNLPDTYATYYSGLGKSVLRYLTAIPVKLNEKVIGVIELLSFVELEDYQVQFVQKSGELLTAILSALKANEKSLGLIKAQKLWIEESSVQEELLRQNLEELQATQEEAARNAEKMKFITEEYQKRENSLIVKVQNYEKQLLEFRESGASKN